MIWAAFNGYMGDSAVCVLVDAPDEPLARAIAVKKLREERQAGDTGYCEISDIHEVTLPVVIEASGL